jgi:hypothetical protein
VVQAFLVVAAAVGFAVRGKDLPPAPIGGGPLCQLATAAEKDGAVVVRFHQLWLHAKVLKVERDGKQVVENEFVYRWVEVPVDVRVDGREVRVLSADGKAIDPATLPKRLAKPTPVVVFRFSPKEEPRPDPFYLRMLREDVVVFAGPFEKFHPPPRK